MYFQIEWTYKVLSTMDKIKVHTMKFQNIGNKEKIIQFGERGKKKKQVSHQNQVSKHC